MNGRNLHFHLQVENIGEVQIEHLRSRYLSPGEQSAARIDYRTAYMTIPPKGRLMVDANSIDVSSTILIVHFVYEVESAIGMKTFTSACKFVLPVEGPRLGTLDPVEFKESVRDQSEQPYKDNILRALTGPEGTLFVSIPDKGADNSTPNQTAIGDPKLRQLRFDGINQLITFQSMVNGVMKVVEQHTKPIQNGQHIVMIEWTRNGVVALKVDDNRIVTK